MIRNILYSLFVHSILILLIYFIFNANPPIEIDKTVKVAVSFVTKPGNSDANNVKTPQPPIPAVPAEMPKPVAPIELPPKPAVKKEQPKPAKSKPKPAPKKPDIDKKTQPKQEAAKAKPKAPDAKSDANKVKEPNKKDDAKQEPEKPKFSEKKPEIKEEVKKEVKKDPPPKVEEKPIPIAESEVEEDELEDGEEIAENQYSFTENSIESLDLLGREKFNIQTQIKRCYKKATKENGDNELVMNAHIFVAKDGFIDLDVVVFKNLPEHVKNGVESDEFRKAKDTIKKALKFCSPLRNLPQDKYDVWKEIDLQFD
jgi:hypothetical protein